MYFSSDEEDRGDAPISGLSKRSLTGVMTPFLLSISLVVGPAAAAAAAFLAAISFSIDIFSMSLATALLPPMKSGWFVLMYDNSMRTRLLTHI